jgi:hypothetical protein
LRGREESPFGGTWWMWRPLAPSIELSRILDATSRGTDAECDHWRSSPLGPPSLLGKGACLSLLVRCSLGRSWGSIELAWEVRCLPELSILFSGGIVVLSRGAADECDHWRSSPRGPSSLLSGKASPLVCWSFVWSFGQGGHESLWYASKR